MGVGTRFLIACSILSIPVVTCGGRPTHAERIAAVAEPSHDAGAPSTTAAAPLSFAPSANPSAAPSPPKAPPGPAQVERIDVTGDRAASIVRPVDDKPPTTVFVPGMCSNANAYLQSFPEAARRHGGIVAIDGDKPCGADGFRTFSWDAGRLHTRIEAALAAAGVTAIPKEGITLVGYSQGAALAEQLVQKWPDRYARLVLIGAPTDPAPSHFVSARALVTMSCERDVPARMKKAAQGITRAGTPARYIQMPGCTHGNIGDGERVFDEAFDWLEANARAPREGAVSEPIAGRERAD